MSSLEACSAAQTAKSSTLPAPTTDAQLVRLSAHTASYRRALQTVHLSLRWPQYKGNVKTKQVVRCLLPIRCSVIRAVEYTSISQWGTDALDVSVDFNPRRHKGGGGVNLTPLDFFGLKFLFLDRLPKALAQLFFVC